MRVWQYKIYLARHMGLSLDCIGQMRADDFLLTIKETDYQRRLELFRLEYRLGQIMCILASSKTRKYKPEQVVGQEPKREVLHRMTQKNTYEVLLGDGNTYTLAILDVNMMEAIEDEFDKSWTELFSNPRVKVVKALLWHMLKPRYPELTREQVGGLLTSRVLPSLVAIVKGMSSSSG